MPLLYATMGLLCMADYHHPLLVGTIYLALALSYGIGMHRHA
jgi:hypothetical protein